MKGQQAACDAPAFPAPLQPLLGRAAVVGRELLHRCTLRFDGHAFPFSDNAQKCIFGTARPDPDTKEGNSRPHLL